MTGVRQGFFTTSSQVKKEEKKRDAISPNLTSSQYQSSSNSIMEGQQQATFKPSFNHPYTQLDTPLTAEKPKKKYQKQLPEVREFQTAFSEQQEQSDTLTMIIAELSQDVESLQDFRSISSCYQVLSIKFLYTLTRYSKLVLQKIFELFYYTRGFGTD